MTIVLFSVVDYNGFSNELFSSFWPPRRRPPSTTVHNSKTYYYTTQRHLLLGRVLVKELYCVRRGHRHDLYQTVAIAIRMKALFNDPQFIRRSLANPFIHRRSRSLWTLPGAQIRSQLQAKSLNLEL